MKLQLDSLSHKANKLNQTIAKNHFLALGKKSSSLLICETNGFTLRAIVATFRDNTLHIEYVMQSRAMVPRAAIAGLISQLEQADVSLPRQAILLSASMVPAMLDLPIDAGVTLAEQRMTELVRWEMEALLTEQLSQWSIGWLLIGRGYLAESQRDQIIQDVEDLKLATKTRGGRAPSRFGEEAIKRGWINREQLEECLALQENLHLLDNQIDCCWVSRPAVGEPGRNHAPPPWRCAAMATALRQDWVDAFAHNGLSLQWVYPSAGMNATALLNDEAQSQVMLEIQPGEVVCTRIEAQQIVSLTVHKCCSHSLNIDELVELCQPAMGAAVKQLWIAGSHPRREALVAELAERLQCICEAWEPRLHEHYQMAPGCALPEGLVCEEDLTQSISSLVAAGLHHLSQTDVASLLRLRGEPPPPPLYKRPRMQVAAAAAGLLFSVGATESYFAWQVDGMQAEILANESKITKIEAANERLANENEEYQEAQAQLEKWQATHQQITQRKKAIESVLIKRQQFVEALLPTLSRIVPEGVMVTAINEQTWYQFNLQGWGLDQQAVDSFNERLTRELETWGLYISDSPSEMELRDDIEGYRFSFTLEPRQRQGDQA